jgi:hypothetical protein
MLMTKTFCDYYAIGTGKITLGCDGLLAIDRATPQTLHIKMDMSCYKFIGAIRKLKSLSHIDWEFKHVEGHQDDVRHVSDPN